MWLELWGHLAAIFAWGGEGGVGGGGGDFEVGGIGICTVGQLLGLEAVCSDCGILGE